MHFGKEAVCWFMGSLLGFVVGCSGTGMSRSDPLPVVPRRPTPTASTTGATPPAEKTQIAQATPSPTPPSVDKPAAPVIQPASATVPAPNSPQSPPGNSLEQLQKLQRLAAQQYAATDSYIARLRRREQVNGSDKGEELLLFKFRKEPWSVYFKWLGEPNNGREVVYVRDRYGNQIHSLLAAGDMPFMPAGKRLALSPDNVFVRNASRHPITDAGIGNVIQRFGDGLEVAAKLDKVAAIFQYIGPVKRPEYPIPLEMVDITFPAGFDPLLPRGGRRSLGFDPASHFPVLIMTFDEMGRQVEYYCYDRIQCPVHLDDDDFNPDKLWPAKSP
jgi:hypothetical protein